MFIPSAVWSRNDLCEVDSIRFEKTRVGDIGCLQPSFSDEMFLVDCKQYSPSRYTRDSLGVRKHGKSKAGLHNLDFAVDGLPAKTAKTPHNRLVMRAILSKGELFCSVSLNTVASLNGPDTDKSARGHCR